MVSPTGWIWVWAGSRSWWWTGKPGVLESMWSQSQTRLSDWTELKRVLGRFLRSALHCQADYYSRHMGSPYMVVWAYPNKAPNLSLLSSWASLYALFWTHKTLTGPQLYRRIISVLSMGYRKYSSYENVLRISYKKCSSNNHKCCCCKSLIMSPAHVKVYFAALSREKTLQVKMALKHLMET